MARKNRWLFRERISKRTFCGLLRLFTVDIMADRAAGLTGLRHRTAAAVFPFPRVRMARLARPIARSKAWSKSTRAASPPTRGHRGRGSPRKVPVVGIRETRRPRPLPDREKLFESNASGHHRGPRRVLGRGHHRRLLQRRRPGRGRLFQAPPDQQIRQPRPLGLVPRLGSADLTSSSRPGGAIVAPNGIGSLRSYAECCHQSFNGLRRSRSDAELELILGATEKAALSRCPQIHRRRPISPLHRAS